MNIHLLGIKFSFVLSFLPVQTSCPQSYLNVTKKLILGHFCAFKLGPKYLNSKGGGKVLRLLLT